MTTMLRSKWIVLACVTVVLVSMMATAAPRKPKPVATSAPATQSQPTKAAYTCPMCGGSFDQPGKCPKCGMALVPMPASAPASHPASATKPAPAAVSKIAHIRLAGPVLEGPANFSLFSDTSSLMTTREWLQRLAQARTDSDVQAVALEMDHPQLSWAQAQELADAVKRLNAVKPVYAFVSDASTSEYLIASAAREVAMEPSSELEIVGLAAELTYFRGTLDMLGIKPQMIQIGDFKGAKEPMANTQPSQEVRQMYDWLLDDLYGQLYSGIAQNRGLTPQAVIAAIDEGPLAGPEALKAKFVDKLVDRIDWRDGVARSIDPDGTIGWLNNYGKKVAEVPDMSNPFTVLSMIFKPKAAPATEDPTIAVIHADGMIVSGRGGEGLFGGNMVGSRTMVEAFEEVRNDPHVKAVVFRINSPGGSALASEEIYQAVRKCAQAKPVITSICGVGASGGYYIACGSKTIMADPAGIVGSIGVVSGHMSTEGLMNKIGVSTYAIKRGKNAGLNLSGEWDAREQEVMRKMAQKIYDQFEKRVRDARGKKIADITQVAQGRVFTGVQAKEKGLVDQVGGFRDAIASAKEAGKVPDNYHILVLPRAKTLADIFGGGASAADSDADSQASLAKLLGQAGADAALLQRLLAVCKSTAGAQYVLELVTIMDRENVLMAMPYHMSIKN